MHTEAILNLVLHCSSHRALHKVTLVKHLTTSDNVLLNKVNLRLCVCSESIPLSASFLLSHYFIWHFFWIPSSWAPLLWPHSSFGFLTRFSPWFIFAVKTPGDAKNSFSLYLMYSPFAAEPVTADFCRLNWTETLSKVQCVGLRWKGSIGRNWISNNPF